MANYYGGARFFDCRVFFNKNYTQLLLISSVMILLPYFLVSAFILKNLFATNVRRILPLQVSLQSMHFGCSMQQV